MQHKTPIMLITGGLGSGKTTLLGHILENAPFRIAVLMNEFGEIAIDSKIIKGRDIDIVELAGGCVCCSMTGEFEAAVREIVENIAPDFIVVEATGVAESDALAFEVEDNLPEVRLDSVVCIVDAYISVHHPYVGYTARTQIESADIILVNKTDLVSESEADTVDAQIREYNDRAVIIRTVDCRVDTKLLFGFGPGERPRHAPTHSESDLTSFTWATERLLDSERFREFAESLPEEVFRAKGFIRFRDGGSLFNYVIGRADFEDFETDATKLVFIGRNLESVRPGIVEGLQQCEVS